MSCWRTLIMSEFEKERIETFIVNMNEEELKFIIRLLPAKLMSDELARREQLKTDQINAINLILSMEEL